MKKHIIIEIKIINILFALILFLMFGLLILQIQQRIILTQLNQRITTIEYIYNALEAK